MILKRFKRLLIIFINNLHPWLYIVEISSFLERCHPIYSKEQSVHFLPIIHLLAIFSEQHKQTNTIIFYSYTIVEIVFRPSDCRNNFQILRALMVCLSFKGWRVRFHINVSITPFIPRVGLCDVACRQIASDWLSHLKLRCHWLSWKEALNLPGVNHPSTAVATEAKKKLTSQLRISPPKV